MTIAVMEKSPIHRGMRYERLLAAARDLPPVTTAVAHPCDRVSLESAIEAAKLGLIAPILVGPPERIRATADEAGLDISPFTIVGSAHSHDSADKAVGLVRKGEAEALMKDRVARISRRTQWAYSRLRSGDADRFRASHLQHAVQDRDGDVDLGGLTLVCAHAQPVADHPLEAADCGFGQRPAVIAGGLLPAHPALLGNKLEVAVALCRRGFGRLARHRARARRYNDPSAGMALGDRAGDAVLVVRSVTRERSNRTRDLVEQGADL